MAKPKKKKQKKGTAVNVSKAQEQRPGSKAEFYFNRKWHLIVLGVVACLLYANTLTHDYAQDDAIVIYDNMFTQEGISGIPGILSNDTFYGFFKEAGKAKLVSGGRYRPFTQLMFAVEWQIFGKNPFVGHFFNVLLYALLGIMIYKTLSLLIIGAGGQGSKGQRLSILIFGISLLYVVHPIHTEAVANIKGRDEIMTMLGAMTALWCSLKYDAEKKVKWQLWAALSFFIALMSKENAITFLAIIPAAYMLFRRKKLLNTIKYLIPFLAATVVFLIIRTAVLGMDFGGESMELMNNPFLKAEGTRWVPFSGAEKIATILFTLGKYVSLLIFPHPLCHDYYPRAIDIMSFGDWQVLASLVLYLAMTLSIFYFWNKERKISFGLLFFLASLSIISNVVFPIGTNMSERFMFMPSLGFMIVIGFLMFKFIKSEKKFLSTIIIISLLFSAKTILRNQVWKDDFTLFTTDVKTNSRSAKLLNAAGGALSTTASKMELGKERTERLESAITYLNKATEIHPTYKNAYLLLGNSSYYLERYDEAIQQYDKALKLDPNFRDAKKNLPIVLRDAGRHYGEKVQDLNKSEAYLKRAYSLNPNDPETNRLMGIVNGMRGNHDQAIKYFEAVTKLQPQTAAGFVNLGTAYRNRGDAAKAQEAYTRAAQIDPEALKKIQQ